METQIRKGTQETQNDGKGKTNFPKEQVENADLSKLMLSKIMTSHFRSSLKKREPPIKRGVNSFRNAVGDFN